MRKAFTSGEISAVAFDIDGTLYPSAVLYRRVALYFLRNARFFIAFNRARKALRERPLDGGEGLPFRERQALLLASELGLSPEDAERMAEDVVYSGLRSFFQRIRLYRHIEEAFRALKGAGFKLGILSDFPPDQKGTVWGLAPMCDAVISAESAGELKPSGAPFRELAQALGVPAERVLYVGNSLKNDAEGARAAGMKAALILSKKDLFNFGKKRGCDIYFYSYRKFLIDVINLK